MSGEVCKVNLRGESNSRIRTSGEEKRILAGSEG